jgi:hypothetical protein
MRIRVNIPKDVKINCAIAKHVFGYSNFRMSGNDSDTKFELRCDRYREGSSSTVKNYLDNKKENDDVIDKMINNGWEFSKQKKLSRKRKDGSHVSYRWNVEFSHKSLGNGRASTKEISHTNFGWSEFRKVVCEAALDAFKIKI